LRKFVQGERISRYETLTRQKFNGIEGKKAPWLNWIEQPPPKGQVSAAVVCDPSSSIKIVAV